MPAEPRGPSPHDRLPKGLIIAAPSSGSGKTLVTLALLRRLARSHTVVSVLHDLPLAARYCDRVLVLEAGQIVREGLPATALDDELLARVFKVRGIRTRVDGGDVLVGISSLPSHQEHAP